MESRRAQRVSEALREELIELVGYELQDPRLIGVTVTEAHLSPDGRHARVLVALRGPEPERRGALAALEHAKILLRRHLATRLRLFRAPELHFEEDASVGGENRIEQLLKRIHKTAARSRATADETAPEPESGDSASPRSVDTKKSENFPNK
jgi:ribosome-binding factor A